MGHQLKPKLLTVAYRPCLICPGPHLLPLSPTPTKPPVPLCPSGASKLISASGPLFTLLVSSVWNTIHLNLISQRKYLPLRRGTYTHPHSSSPHTCFCSACFFHGAQHICNIFKLIVNLFLFLNLLLEQKFCEGRSDFCLSQCAEAGKLPGT